MPNPRPLIKAATKLTPIQWRRLLERVVLRQEGKSTVKGSLPGEEAMGKAVGEVFKTEPVQSKVYGRLYEHTQVHGEHRMQPRDYPYVEAVIRHIKSKGALTAESKPLPSSKVLTAPGGEIHGVDPHKAVTRSKMYKRAKVYGQLGGSYEKRVYKPIDPVSKRINPEVIEAEKLKKAKLVRKAKQLAPAKKSFEKVRGGKISVEAASSDNLIKHALMLDQMWKFIGGKRTVTGKFWNQLRSSAPGRRKVADARDYFYRIGLKWIENPEATAKTYPREVKSLERIWEELNNAVSQLK